MVRHKEGHGYVRCIVYAEGADRDRGVSLVMHAGSNASGRWAGVGGMESVRPAYSPAWTG